MSLFAFAIGVVLAGQVAADNRYGPPPAVSSAPEVRPDYGNSPSPPPTRSAAPAGGLNPFSDNSRGTVPPPPLATPQRSAPISPATPEDYGLGRTRNDSEAGAVRSEPSTGPSPSAMMRAMLTAPTGARLTGRPLTLAEVVAGAPSRAEQTQRIDAYWDLCASVADYYLGLREQDELERLQTLVPKVGPTWQQAETELGVRIGTSQRGAVAAQYRLASMMGSGSSNLPLPGDMPHCGDYFVRYDQIFAGRPSPEARELSELLPLRYEELSDAATAVTRAEEWLNAIAAQRSNVSDGTGMLRALELLALRRRAFVQIVRDYNRRIARYTELASPGQVDSERLISMLIKRPGATPSTATRPATTSPPYNRQSQTMPESAPEMTPRTFDEAWTPAGATTAADALRDEAVEPASINRPQKQSGPRRERSLLVPRSGT